MRLQNRLGALAVGRQKTPGMYADGGGLYLQVSRSGSKSWIFRFAMGGREREMGLGPLHTISLSEARDLALEARRLKLRGIDPIEARNAKRTSKKLEDAKAMDLVERACLRPRISKTVEGEMVIVF